MAVPAIVLVILSAVVSMILSVLVFMILSVLVLLNRIFIVRVAESYKMKKANAQGTASIDKHAGIARLPGRGVAVGDHFFIRIRVEMPAVGGNPK